MSEKLQLVGKTISGIIATAGEGDNPHRIWMLQFTDGTHVEFVSPSARRRLIRATAGQKRVAGGRSEAALAQEKAA